MYACLRASVTERLRPPSSSPSLLVYACFDCSKVIGDSNVEHIDSLSRFIIIQVEHIRDFARFDFESDPKSKGIYSPR